MNIYRPKFIRKETVATDTQAFHFEKPSGFTFTAGQFITFKLPGDPSIVPKRGRYDFSLASAPREHELFIVTRMRDTHFKRHLTSLSPGDGVEIEGPFGHMALPDDRQIPIIMMAGGMGIAPFRSMIYHAMGQSIPNPVRLFYSNRTAAHAAFFDDLQQLSLKYSSLRFIPVMTQPETGLDTWNGETGYFTPELLNRHLETIHQSIYYIVGPVNMVISTKRMVKALGVPEEKIQMEVFTGY